MDIFGFVVFKWCFNMVISPYLEPPVVPKWEEVIEEEWVEEEWECVEEWKQEVFAAEHTISPPYVFFIRIHFVIQNCLIRITEVGMLIIQ